MGRELHYFLADHPKTRTLLQKNPDLFPGFGEPAYSNGEEQDMV